MHSILCSHFVDHKAQGRKAEVWGTGRGADEDVTTLAKVVCTKCRHEWRE